MNKSQPGFIHASWDKSLPRCMNKSLPSPPSLSLSHKTLFLSLSLSIYLRSSVGAELQDFFVWQMHCHCGICTRLTLSLFVSLCVCVCVCVCVCGVCVCGVCVCVCVCVGRGGWLRKLSLQMDAHTQLQTHAQIQKYDLCFCSASFLLPINAEKKKAEWEGGLQEKEVIESDHKVCDEHGGATRNASSTVKNHTSCKMRMHM